MLAIAGCAPSQRIDLLEARLRQHEDRIFALQSELEAAREEQRVVRREADALRTRLADDDRPVLLPEQADALFRMEQIRLSKLMTGGVDRDGRTGDEVLSVVLLPLDAQGSLVKVPGRIELEVLDLARPSGARRIGHWTYEPGTSADHWHRGLITSGYVFRLPWQQPPSSSQLMLMARMTTSDGRRFETHREVIVEPPAAEAMQSVETPGDAGDAVESHGATNATPVGDRRRLSSTSGSPDGPAEPGTGPRWSEPD